jgi:hypothetical protein
MKFKISFVSCKVVFLKLFFKFSSIYLSLEELVNEKYFLVKEIYDLIFKKYFFFILDRKYFLEIIKKLKILYYY